MENIFKSRPFKTRNADEYNLADILSLFVNPIDGLSSPLEFENSIIKGRMGSGKTMYLRANYAYYLYNIVPRLINDEELILPVFVKLSDFQHLRNATEIYRALIIKIVEELSSVYLKLQNAKELANIHKGMRKIEADIYFDEKIKQTAHQLLKLGSEEYIQKLNHEFGLSSKLTYRFIEASANYKKNEALELKRKTNPGIGDIVIAYDTLLKDSDGKILILIDEAGSLDKSFFRTQEGESFFEIFMNQLRTADFVRTKIAIYPNSYSDILTETRYGDVIQLEENIIEEHSFNHFRRKAEQIITNYLNKSNNEITLKVEDLFDIENNEDGDCIEEIINGSGGNYRRLIQLFDSAMNESFKRNNGNNKIEYLDSVSALKKHCEGLLGLYTDPEKEYLLTLAKACKSRSTFKFKYPNNAPNLYKYLTKSQEFNLLNVIELGTGRKGTTYAFDYSYCVLNDIPTHNIKSTERIDKRRSLLSGTWISRVTNINDEIIAQSEIPNKIEGGITFRNKDRGFILGNDSIEYFFIDEFIIESDRGKPLWIGKKMKFIPTYIGDTKMATQIEIL